MAMVGGILSAVGMGMSAQGSQQNAAFLETQGNYNATIGENEAVYQQDIARYDEAQFRKSAQKMIGSSQAAAGVAGVAVGEGSAQDALLENIRETELDALIIRHGGEVRASRLRQQAALDRYAASKGAQAERLSGTATAISSAGTMASKYDWNSRNGSRTLPKSSSSSSLPSGSYVEDNDYSSMG